MTVPFRLDETRLAEGLAHLSRIDPDIARALAAHGTPPLRAAEEGFAALLRSIVGQQVSVQAARSIWGRIEAAADPVTPRAILALDDAALRACGLSGAKMRYARALAVDVDEGRLDFDALRTLDDDAAIAALTRAKGVGRWTAEIYLMFALGRPDVMPGNDIGLVVAAHHLKRMRKRPDPKRMLAVARAWRPWRTVAALFLWHYRHNMPDFSDSPAARAARAASLEARKQRAAERARAARKAARKPPAAKTRRPAAAKRAAAARRPAEAKKR